METVCPEEITFEDSSISPPPPVEVTENEQTSFNSVEDSISPWVTVPAVEAVPSVIVFAVQTPVEAAPKAVESKIGTTISVEADA
jgi:hypothetical protein